MKRCPKCGEEGTDEDVFCEADGVRLEGGPAPAATVPTPDGTSCSACGEANPDSGDGYCSACGHRLAPSPSRQGPPGHRPYVPGDVAAPRALSARLAELSDRGLRHPHNEDATAVARGEIAGEPWAVLVVCDGVSTSTHADRASKLAAETTRDALAHFLTSGDVAFEGVASALAAAIRAAHIAVCATPLEPSTDPADADKPPLPGTTLVAALVFRHRLAVGWVGDSRAYWVASGVARGGAELLSRDHSWVNETVDKGELTLEEALASPLAHALTRCLGPLEGGSERIEDVLPEVRVRDLPGPGHLVLCTDGLWNYFPSAEEVAELVRSPGPTASAADIAKHLVHQALRRGGGDNVSVAVYKHG